MPNIPSPATDSPPTRRPLGAGAPYPDDYAPGDRHLADQRHARVRDAATRIIERAAAVAEDGHDVRDAGVHLQFAIESSTAALDDITGLVDCACGGDHHGPAALLLIAELALRVGGALAVGRAGA